MRDGTVEHFPDLEAAVARVSRVLEGAVVHKLDFDVELEPVGGEGRHLGGGEGRRLEDDEDVSAAGYHRRDGAAAAEPGWLFSCVARFYGSQFYA